MRNRQTSQSAQASRTSRADFSEWSFFTVGAFFVSILKVISVLLQQDINKLFTNTVRRGDIVLFGFQPIEDLFGGGLIGWSTFSVKVGQYFVQTINPDLGLIRKVQHTPTNCRRLSLASSHSSDDFKLRHIQPPSLMNPDDLDLFFHLFKFNSSGNQFCFI